MIFGACGGCGSTIRRLGSHTVLPTFGAFEDDGTTVTCLTPGSIVTFGKPSGSGTLAVHAKELPTARLDVQRRLLSARPC